MVLQHNKYRFSNQTLQVAFVVFHTLLSADDHNEIHMAPGISYQTPGSKKYSLRITELDY
jgi:hypothetical protein